MTSLKNYFVGTASKYLSAVDATGISNQHEIGSNKFTAILGDPGSNKLRFKATFLYFKPDADEPESCADVVTYYDTRLNQPHRSAEYRLYYRSNPITEQLNEGDFCLVGLQTNGELLVVMTPADSDHERRIRYLFELEQSRQQWAVDNEMSGAELDMASRSILDALGVELIDAADEMLDRLVEKFGLKFPTTRDFSLFAREMLGDTISPEEDPDRALEEWMKQEERLFRSLEKAIVEVRLKEGFDSVEPFISFSLSVQNRRKSRVGHALENHLAAIFLANGLSFERGAKTEGNSKPDFIFPSSAAYRDPAITSPPLRMLAAKTTCKDRWRQILAEAARIPKKHLFTLETAISSGQTDEMKLHGVELVTVPSVMSTYTPKQQVAMLNLEGFIRLFK